MTVYQGILVGFGSLMGAAGMLFWRAAAMSAKRDAALTAYLKKHYGAGK